MTEKFLAQDQDLRFMCENTQLMMANVATNANSHMNIGKERS